MRFSAFRRPMAPPPAALLIAVLIATTSASAPAKPADVKPARPATLGAVEADTLKHALERDRKDTDDWLKTSPTSYLATIQRRDFGDQSTLSVGRASDNDVRIDDPEVAAHHLRVTVAGDSFHVEALDDTAHFTSRSVVLRSATLPPSAIGLGRFSVRLSHQRYPALIVFDPKSPGYARYHGLHWFAPDFRYRYVLSLTPNPAPDTVTIMSTRGNARRALRIGWFDFVASGQACRLEATRLLEPGVGESDFGIFFRDATTGKETYGVGRYVDPDHLPDGRFALDFNNAYNPACAVSEHYNCPIPRKTNTLKVAIRAGEMDSHYH